VKYAFAAAFVAATVLGTAIAQDKKSPDMKAAEPAQAQCTPAPKVLVKKDTAPGTGDVTAEFRSPILVSYTGWFYDPCAKDFKGEKFDTSEGRATPFGFILGAGKVIKGWDEGLLGMKEGGKRTLVIPPDLAYGAAGRSKIPPNSTLVFDVEILKILVGPPTPAPAPAPAKQ
jgi:FKBP-type peptidyl-prolyl cis-trans isomerase FkpA